MNWRFKIKNNRTNVITVIEEPVGWDANKCELKRDPDWHGIFFNNSGDDYEFHGQAERLLKAEYDQYGAQGDMNLIIEDNCGNGYELFDEGKFDFVSYVHSCGDMCFVKCPTESTNDVQNVRNRKNQKADLDAAVSFNGVTALAPYAKLSYPLPLPSKGIFIQDRAVILTSSVEVFDGGLEAVLGSGHNVSVVQIEFGLPDNQLSEIGSFFVKPTHTMDLTSLNSASVTIAHFPAGVFPGNGLWPLNLSPIENFTPGSPNYTDVENPVQFDIRIKGVLDILETYLGTTSIYLLRLPDRPGYATNGEHEADYEFLHEATYVNPGCGVFPGCYLAPNSGSVNFDFVFAGNVTINKNDRFYLFMALSEDKTNTELANIAGGAKALRLTLDDDSHISITNLSHTPATESKVYAINEVISRVTEVITDDQIRAYSDYFGRTDSEPYAVAADGCGSLEVVTDGLRIRRQENKTPGQTNPFSLSLDDIFGGINPIHNIGIGIEPDPNRSGFNRIRVEPWHHFYNDTVVMSCIGVNLIKRSAYAKEIYSTFNFGYQKYEAEQYNGLDEFLTKRIYRTTLSQVTNDLKATSSMVASGYALEVTRRIGDTDSKDWRYDKDIFIICCARIPKYRVTFDPTQGVYGTISFDFVGDPVVTFGIGLGGGSVDILGSLFNDGTINFTGYYYVDNRLTFLVDVSSAPITAEVTDGVSFTSATYAPDSLFVEQGNVDTPLNIVDPGTLYNYRISPIRNAMRWMNKILESYRQFDLDAKIIFTDGSGNYFAQGEMLSSSCRLENGVIAENATLNKSNFDDVNDAKPFLIPERVLYDFPMSSAEYKLVKANPYGQIYFENDCDNGFGYIDTIDYKPDQGIATFTLIPKTD